MFDIIAKFDIVGKAVVCQPYGSGHVNTTYVVACDSGRMYILQRINTSTFKDPDGLMRNLAGVTARLAERASDRREVLSLVKTTEGKACLVTENGEYWRMYDFVVDSMCFDHADARIFYESALAFGRFQNLLAGYPADTLCETIPRFHDTPWRFEALKQAVKDDPMGRVKDVRAEIDELLSHEEFGATFMDLLSKGELPLRVTHNDTKLNNVLFDVFTGKGLCVIDLDTVMPGLAMNDFGDSIRFGASTAAEDERDLDKVRLDMELYEAYAKGFLEACGNDLTPLERELLPTGAKMMTLECGVRFMADYLVGDTYFHIARPGHNLDRCRTQLKLVREYDEHWQQMQRIVKG